MAVVWIEIEDQLFDVMSITSITKKERFDTTEECWKYSIVVNASKGVESSAKDTLPMTTFDYVQEDIRDQKLIEIKHKLLSHGKIIIL